jgi:hypothetical protein
MVDKSKKVGSDVKPKELNLDQLQSSLAGIKLFEEYTKADEKTKKIMRKLPFFKGKGKAEGGEVKKYMGGGSVHKKKNKMLTTKGWGASRKT